MPIGIIGLSRVTSSDQSLLHVNDLNSYGKSNRYVCYSSPDLITWTPHGEILKDAPPRVYYRPYVKFNQRTGKYVLWCNADNHYTVALAEKPEGPFAIQNTNVLVKNGDTQGDFGLFVDKDGTGYITYSFCPPHIDWSGKTEGDFQKPLLLLTYILCYL